MSEPYTPSVDRVRSIWVRYVADSGMPVAFARANEEFDRFLAAVEQKARETVLPAEEQIANLEANMPPCDGGCNYNDGPDEMCSLHGRPVAEVWDALNVMQGRVAALTDAIEKALAVLPDRDTARVVSQVGSPTSEARGILRAVLDDARTGESGVILAGAGSAKPDQNGDEAMSAEEETP